MITKADFNKLNSEVRALSAACEMVDNDQHRQLLIGRIVGVRDSIKAFELAYNQDQKCSDSTESKATISSNQTVPRWVMAIHDLEFGEMEDFSLKEFVFRTSPDNVSKICKPGVDAFGLTLSRLQDTMYCRDLVDKLFKVQFEFDTPYHPPLRSEAIMSRATALWADLMQADDLSTRIQRQDTFAGFIERVIATIRQFGQTNVDGVEIFRTGPNQNVSNDQLVSRI